MATMVAYKLNNTSAMILFLLSLMVPLKQLAADEAHVDLLRVDIRPNPEPAGKPAFIYIHATTPNKELPKGPRLVLQVWSEEPIGMPIKLDYDVCTVASCPVFQGAFVMSAVQDFTKYLRPGPYSLITTVTNENGEAITAPIETSFAIEPPTANANSQVL